MSENVSVRSPILDQENRLNHWVVWWLVRITFIWIWESFILTCNSSCHFPSPGRILPDNARAGVGVPFTNHVTLLMSVSTLLHCSLQYSEYIIIVWYIHKLGLESVGYNKHSHREVTVDWNYYLQTRYSDLSSFVTLFTFSCSLLLFMGYPTTEKRRQTRIRSMISSTTNQVDRNIYPQTMHCGGLS